MTVARHAHKHAHAQIMIQEIRFSNGLVSEKCLQGSDSREPGCIIDMQIAKNTSLAT